MLIIILENLTKEQFSGSSILPRLNIFNVSQDALNPRMNTELLRNRLWTIDHYKYRYGAKHTFWVHYAMKNAARHCWTYKFNYLAKGALAFMTYRQCAAYSKADEENFLSEMQKTSHRVGIASFAGIFFGTCMFI